ncbi:glycogen/starch/alpha-glucan phosphorylase [Candidatus Cetobacterium colombiensis]|uniref:Alpha-1,4 glucan phosphorylase n=1 Tax=Candidatus Cetobacterium colombiensis TaxID=3073100 RepID=A0ABU4WBK6_9FUSO|nr:glycogen/starch/alpha-glucan phosphorylase [Candidatus Cetobacterium colombiensis]MDX8335858.1 glycogen/starch/alpha-glucan phosphorylase [Candidatus Cetobacterium colombiensis]
MILNKNKFKDDYIKRLTLTFAQSPADASLEHKYLALGKLIRDYISESWAETNMYYTKHKSKQMYYFSMEFLLGRLLNSYLLNLDIRDVVKDGLRDLNIDLDELLEQEPDPALGNGGLGRLAACFMDSLASLGFPGHGCGIRFKHGLFNQKIVNGYQKELLNNWLKEDFLWEIKKPEKSVTVRFGGQVHLMNTPTGIVPNYFGCEEINAVPYDIPILGANMETVNTLRLFSAEVPEEEIDLNTLQKGDYQKFIDKKFAVEAISQILYPDDSSYQGKLLRLKQEYFFVSAGLQSILRKYKKTRESIHKFSDFIAIHINDTHPSIAVGELMRLLLDEEGLDWDSAWDITVKTLAYTNHTILSEAMERWPYDMFKKTVPRILMIIEEIDRRFCEEVSQKYEEDYHKIDSMRIIFNGEVRMANLAIIGSHSINGVAKIHTEILKNRELHDFYLLYPERFNNKTNGITHRRWLKNDNPELYKLVTEKSGPESINDTNKFINFLKFVNDDNVLHTLEKIKLKNKEKVVTYVKQKYNIDVNPFSIFDVQVKRLHGYKRQLLNIFHIIYLYNKLKENPELDIVPRTFFFGAKAAPSYYLAKNIIKLITSVANVINNDPSIRSKIKVVFLENYGVSIAELIIPAGDVSEQISTASKEASGTGNMKFMMNGAVTLATLDGANVEIYDEVGDSNMVVFGLTSQEVMDLEKNRSYNFRDVLNSNLDLQKILRQLSDGTFSGNKEEFNAILNHIYGEGDPYFVLKDFPAYVEAQQKINDFYEDKKGWLQMCLVNIAHSGKFSSDNSIRKYADEIWHIKEVKRGE